MNRKNLISLTIGLCFLALSLTGVLLYVKQKAHAVEITHTIMGLVFTGFAVFHILNNWPSLKSYSKDRKAGKWTKEIATASGIFGILLIGGATGLLEPIAEAGRFLGPKRPPKAQTLSYELTNPKVEGNFKIFIEKVDGNEETPVAVLANDLALFVPSQSVKSVEDEPLERQIAEEEAKLENLEWGLKANHEGFTPLKNFSVNADLTADSVQITVKSIIAGKTEELKGKIIKGRGMQSIVGANAALKKVFVEY